MKREKPPSCLPQLTVLAMAAAAVATMPAAAIDLVAQACNSNQVFLKNLARDLFEMKEGQQRQAVADATAEAVRVADAAACAQEHAHMVALVELKKMHTAKLADLKEAARAQEAKLTTELAEAAKAATKASVERENALSQVRSEMSCLGISTQQA